MSSKAAERLAVSNDDAPEQAAPEATQIAPDHPAPHVFVAMAAVQSTLAKVGIEKTVKKDAGVKYAFRGIDAVMNVLAPILSENKLLIVPQILSRGCVERKTQNGAAMYVVTVEAEFSLVSGVDGSTFKGRTIGEAQDMGDKATNKAMSIAYKYFCFQTFCIPLDPADDPDGQPSQSMAPETNERPAGSAPSRGGAQPADKGRRAEADAAEARQEGLRERANRVRILLGQVETPNDIVKAWQAKAIKVREELADAGMKGELERLKDYYAQRLTDTAKAALKEPASSAGVTRVWKERLDLVLDELQALGAKAAIVTLSDFYAQTLSKFGRDDEGQAREGAELEGAI